MLRNTINQIQKEEDKVKEKDAKFFDKHVCSHCESNKIYICEPCMNDMAKQYDNYSN
jgi:predicted methyltransferase